MAKTTVDLLITELCKRMSWDVTAASTPRADALSHLNRAERYILQRFSLNFLSNEQTVTLANSASSSVLPASPAIDAGKDITIQNDGLNGELTYVPPDEWYESGMDNYALWQTNRPYEWTLIGDGAGALVLNFRPANTTGGNITLKVIGQMLPIALIDNSAGTGSKSLLPETFEDSILLKRAEGTLKRLNRRPGYQELIDEVEKDLEAFYGQFRTSKEKPWPDREQIERKTSREKLAEGV